MRYDGILCAGIMLAALGAAAAAQTIDCNASAGPEATIELPGRPFAAVPSGDGCTIYVSLLGAKGIKGAGGVAAIARAGGRFQAVYGVEIDPAPTDIVLSHDGSLLIAANGDGVAFLDPARLLAKDDKAKLGHFDDGGRAAIYVAMTPDDRFAFVSDERSESISVIDVAKARATGFDSDRAVVGQIPVGNAPVGLAFSADGNTLFTTSEGYGGPNWPGGCKPEDPRDREHPEGALFVVDVRRAETDPAHAVLRAIPAGCNPVRVVLSPAGERTYVTARDSDALNVFDTAKLVSGAADPRIATVAVGTSPVGVAATDTRVIVTNSNRFGGGGDQTLSVVDATKIGGSASPILGSITVGSFPRELRITEDGKTLIVTNFNSNALSVIDLAAMPLTPP